jgi:hypothetical protein
MVGMEELDQPHPYVRDPHKGCARDASMALSIPKSLRKAYAQSQEVEHARDRVVAAAKVLFDDYSEYVDTYEDVSELMRTVRDLQRLERRR